MSYTYQDQLDDAIYKWSELPEGKRKNELARSLLKRYLSIRREDVFHLRLPDAYPDWDLPRHNIRPPIPKELQ